MNALRALIIAAAAALTACDCDCSKPSPAGSTAGAANPDGAPTPIFTCRNGGGVRLHPATGQSRADDDANIAATLDADSAAARAAREAWRDRTFEEYLQSLRRECGPNGKFLVNGDVAIGDLKRLREFFEERIQGASSPRIETVWTAQQKRSLTYCVSTAFAGQHDRVVADMEAATGAWEQVANVDFSHVAAQDATCTANNSAVLFDVNPVDVDGDYLARAFVPGEPRTGRNVYVDLTALALDPAQELQLSGVLRHELGHTLGFDHAHTRPASGACFDDAGDEPIAADDELSVMHYPQCNGGTGWKRLLTERDKNVAACVYGAAPGFSINPAICEPRWRPVSAGESAVARSFPDQNVARGATTEYTAFAAQPGSLVRVSMQPHGARPGDPDLYVRLGRKPVVRPAAYTCRPYLIGAQETCELDAEPPPDNVVHVLVRGYTAGSYDLDVSFVPLTP